MRELIEFLTREITGKDVPVTEESEEGFVKLTIKPDQEDMGILIGRGGRVIKALRNLLRVRATLEKKGVQLSLAEE